MKHFFGLFIVLFTSCQNGQQKNVPLATDIDTNTAVSKLPPLTESIPNKLNPQREEFFADSLHIGRKSRNKIEVAKYRNGDSIYVVIKFYAKQNNKWNLKNSFQFEKDAITSCDTKLEDFNNDGLNDMTYISDVAARGANEVRRMFIYQQQKDELVYLKNSEDYPNMLYNKELNCIDAFLIYGGCSTVFLKIKGDSLIKFASVDLSDGLSVRTYDKKGVEKIILEDTTNKAGFIRYKDFNPLKEYE